MKLRPFNDKSQKRRTLFSWLKNKFCKFHVTIYILLFNHNTSYWRELKSRSTNLKFLICNRIKEWSLCHKLKFSNPYIYGTWYYRLLIFQTKIMWCNRINSLKYLRSTTLGCRDIGFRKSEFVSKTQFLCIVRKIKTRGVTRSQSRSSTIAWLP